MIIRRHSPPTQLDQAPKGTICEVINDHVVIESYVQTNDDDTTPLWGLLDE